MFTGIIECVGRVESVQIDGELVRLRVHAPAVAADAELGASVAVNGACLTVTGADAGCVSFDAIRETLDRTSMASLREGSRVNLERALRAGDRLDGHIVQGHVDATGRVRALEERGEDVRLAIDCDPDFARQLVPKGSVTIDGISLTVVGTGPAGFDVALIPHTLRETNLSDRRPGDTVNLEADVLGKYVLRYLESLLGRDGAGLLRAASGG